MLFVTIAAVRQARNVLASPTISTPAIRRLRFALKSGRVDGTNGATCFFGHLGKGMNMGYREICSSFGISVEDGTRLSPVETLCWYICKGHKPSTSWRSRLLLKLCEKELERRRAAKKHERAKDDRLAVEKLISEVATESAELVGV